VRVRLKQPRLLQFLATSPLSQNHWALKLGLSRGHWSEIVNGKHPYPSPRTRQLMLETLGLPIEELFEIEAGVAPWADSDFRRAIADRYLIDTELGQGGMGAVYLARDVRHGRSIAIKVIALEAVSGVGVSQFLREIATVAQLQHPHILPLFDSGEAAGHPFYAMPLIRGGSLRGRLDATTRVPAGEAADLVRGIAAALDHAHEHRVLHCDVKPENILLDGAHPYVMDFGIARKLRSEAPSWTLRRELDLSAGTPAYVSPEQASGDRDVDARSDVYSLGCVVYEMLSGRKPFEGTTTEAVVSRRFIAPPPPLRDFAPEVPWAVEAAVARAMEFDPGRRHAGAGEFARALSAGARDVSGALARLSVGTTRAIGTVRRRVGRPGSLSFGSTTMDSIVQDLVHAWRGIRRAPGFALVVILTLGLALGANATMFGITDRLLLQPPPGIGEPDGLRRVLVARWINGPGEPRSAMSYPHFLDLRDRTRSFTQVAAMDEAIYSLGTGAEARPVRVTLATGRYFPLLRVPAFLGRYFGEAEDAPPSGLPVAVLSHAFWLAAFGADSSVVGRGIPLGSRRYTVIGVAPRGFNGTELTPVDLWIPLSTRSLGRFGDSSWREERGSQWLETFARLNPASTAEAAEEDATRAYRVAHLEDPGEFHRRADARLSTLAGGAPSAAAAGTVRVSAWLLSVAAVLLIIACANIANLMLARGLTRRGEIAVRLALGVSRGRLVRQLLTESLVLAGLGALAGLAIAWWGAGLVRAVLLPDTAWTQSPLNPRVLAVTLAATVFCALAAGLFPLWRSTRGDLATQLHGGMRSTPSHSRRFRAGLLLLQTSLCTALLIGAGLFLRSIREVRDLDLGFQPRELAAVSVDLTVLGASPEEIAAFYRQAVERLANTPGIAGVGASIGAPFLTTYGQSVRVAGMDSLPRLAGGGPYYVRATAGTLEAMGVRLVRGRLLAPEDDRPGAEPVTVVTDRTARLLWPGRDPLGECLLVGQERTCHRVTGIIADLHRQSLDENARPFLLFFTPLGLLPAADAVPEQLLVRTTAPLDQASETVRRALLALRPDLPYIRMLPYQEMIDRRARSWQLGAALLTVFGGLSLLIAAIGLYGVLSYAVTQRRQELGIRAALGATPESLMRLVMRYGVVAAGVGVALGAALALAVSGRLQPLLFRTQARDPLVFVTTAALVLVIALAASALPGRRATRADPLEALRAD
jgi:predicted permease